MSSQHADSLVTIDYNSFKKHLIDAIDIEGPAANEYANQRWAAYGQKFLQICISHKTAAAVEPR